MVTNSSGLAVAVNYPLSDLKNGATFEPIERIAHILYRKPLVLADAFEMEEVVILVKLSEDHFICEYDISKVIQINHSRTNKAGFA